MSFWNTSLKLLQNSNFIKTFKNHVNIQKNKHKKILSFDNGGGV
jgi:hypothetical protein